MIRQYVVIFLSVAILAFAASCDKPVQTSSGGGVHRGNVASSGESVVVINGEPITAGELIAAPALRQGLRQFIYFHNLRKVAKREGLVADLAEVDEHVDLLKQRLVEEGETWENYLNQMAITEDEYRANIVDSLLQDAIVEKRVGVTDEKLRGVWEDQQEKVINEYMTKNFLPESDRDTVTYEMCYEILFMKVMRIEGVPVMGDLSLELIDNATLEITCMSDVDQAKLYEFLILESTQTPTEEIVAAEATDTVADGATETEAVSTEASDSGVDTSAASDG